MRTVFLLALCVLPGLGRCQSRDSASLLPFLHGFRVKPPVESGAAAAGGLFSSQRTPVRPALLLNLRGVEIASEQAPGDLATLQLHKAFPRLGLQRRDALVPDTILGQPCRVLRKTQPGAPAPTQQVFYFLPGAGGMVDGFSFTGFDSIPQAWIAGAIALIRNQHIPDSLISSEGDSSFLLADRHVAIGRICRWTGTNILLCPDNGELNWSLHPSAEEAKRQLVLQRTRNLSGPFEAVAESQQDLLFEDVLVTATRLLFRLKGAKGVLAKKLEGSRDLIVYYVQAPVRGVHVSCVLSYWTSDYKVPESGLPPLLHQVMRLR